MSKDSKFKFSLFLLSILILLLLIGPIHGQRKTVIKYWLWLDDPTDPIFPELVKQFNSQNPNIQVEYELIPLAQYYDKLITAVGAGTIPDCARFKDWWLGTFVDAGALEPLDNYLKSWKGYNDVIPNLWNTGKTHSKSPIYMMPHQFITFYLYYRKDWFKEKNLPPPTDLNKFIDAAKKLTDPSKNRYGFGLRGGAGGQDQWLAFMVAQGARLVDRNGKVIADSPEAILANQWYIDLYRVHKVVPPSAPTDGYAQVLGAFQAGITAMMAHHVGSSVLVTQKLGEENVGVVPMPSVDPKKPATMMTMSGNVIFSNSKNKDEAFKFISWLTEKEQMDKWCRSKQGQLPVLKSVASMPYYKNNIFFKVSLDQAKYAIAWPPLPGVGYISAQLWQNLMQRALIGEISSREMMEEIANALRKK